MIIRIILLSLVLVSDCLALDLDDQIALIKKVYQLQPKNCDISDSSEQAKINAGRELFESKILSGNQDISCRNCHLDQFGSADGLPIAVGVGGEGEGKKRYQKGGVLVQRNALSLKGRGHPRFRAFFWDGKAQQDGQRIVTQFGDHVTGFDSPLAAAAILPLVERDEFLGETSYLVSNDIQAEVGDKVYYDRYIAVGKGIRDRIRNSRDSSAQTLREKLSVAGIKLQEMELVDIGNLLAQFIADEFRCEESFWDRYLEGDLNALTPQQKKGAVLFFGKGRCASCHDGELFSDFEYNSIGTPQGGYGVHSRHRDIGRAGVTKKGNCFSPCLIAKILYVMEQLRFTPNI
ncbi:MAG: methylamine utilization protein MauG, partial [gamma proteobacterium symbiont of Clathrolucina costata]